VDAGVAAAMITAGNRLAFLSGLSGVSAATHLRQIAGIYGTAAVMLVAYSGYGPNHAWVHLFADPQAHDTGGGASGRRAPDYQYDQRVSPRSKKRDIVETVLERAGIAGTVDAAVVREALAPFNLDTLSGQTVTEQQAARRRLRDVLESIKPQTTTEQSLIDLKRWTNRMRAAILIVLLMMQ
jgi:hypothetical protein